MHNLHPIRRCLLISFLLFFDDSFLVKYTSDAYSIIIPTSPPKGKCHSSKLAKCQRTLLTPSPLMSPPLRQRLSMPVFSDIQSSLHLAKSTSNSESSNVSSSSSSSSSSVSKFNLQNKKYVTIPFAISLLLLSKKVVSIFSRNLFQDTTYILSFVIFLAGFGVTLERNTTIGKALSAPLATMSLALIVANLGFAPFESPIYNIVNRKLVPLAVPLLLFDSNLRRILTDTGTVLIAFLVGAFSTIVGTLIAFPFIPLTSLGNNEGQKIASALAARHIGGAVNFVAVAETLGVSGSSVTAAIAADNVVVALYFAFLFFISKSGIDGKEEDMKESLPSLNKQEEVDDDDDSPIDAEDLSSPETQTSDITLSTLSTSLTISSTLVFLGGILTRTFLPPGTSSLPLISILTVSSATIFPSFFRKLRNTGTALGILFMQMFFAVSGLGGSIALVLRKAPSLFLFSTIQIAIHFLTLVGIGKYLFKLPSNELYLASNANVGGPTTAAAMAQAKGWTRLILPALLIGILGYATATPIALALGSVLGRLPIIQFG